MNLAGSENVERNIGRCVGETLSFPAVVVKICQVYRKIVRRLALYMAT